MDFIFIIVIIYVVYTMIKFDKLMQVIDYSGILCWGLLILNSFYKQLLGLLNSR